MILRVVYSIQVAVVHDVFFYMFQASQMPVERLFLLIRISTQEVLDSMA